MSRLDRDNRDALQTQILSGEIDSDTLLPDLCEYVECNYYNLFMNTETGEHSAIPVCRKGNPQFALRQSFKKADLQKILKGAQISVNRPDGIYSHFGFITLTFKHSEVSRDMANYLITSKGGEIRRFFARLEKHLNGGYAKVLVKESTVSGYPAVHIILYLDTPLKVKWHRKSNSFRPDISDTYTKHILGKLKNLSDWNSKSPLWDHGFLDIYCFTRDEMKIKGYSNPLNYISKYITKSLDLENNPELKKAQRISELPIELRTRAWTILNNIIWNSHTWVISKSFKEKLKRIKERIYKLKSDWKWIDTIHISNPILYKWMGWTPDKLPPGIQSSLSSTA